MTSPPILDGQPLPAEARVLRLPKPPPDFRADNYRPSWQVLEPSSGDKRAAEERSKPVRVSVWDEARTTVTEARTFRSSPSIVLRLRVQDVSGVAEVTNRPMLVVYDLLDEPDATRAGADGHAGIEGLRKASGESSPEWRARLDRLAERLELLEGPV